MTLRPRAAPSAAWLWLAPLLAVLATGAAGSILLAALGYDVGPSLHALFVSPLGTGYGLAELVLKATPLALIGTGLALGFRAGVWNIGAEGQLTAGAIAAGGTALAFAGSEWPFQLPLLLLAGVLGGMLWAAPAALLRASLGVSEILVSLMLTYVALLLLSFLVYGPWKDPAGFNFPQSVLFDAAAAIPPLLPGTRLHVGALAGLLVVGAASFALNRMLFGLALKTQGDAARAARYAGFSEARLVWTTLLAGGGLAGLAGAFEVAGPIGQLVPVISPGYGFTAIIAAFLGRLQPWGVLAASLLLALTFIGGENAQIEAGLPRAVTAVFQGLLLFFLLGADVLVRYRPERRRNEAVAAS